MSQGYQLGSGAAQPFELFGPAPAGAVATSGADMGRFMIAHLQNGQYGSTRILRPETAQLMLGTALPIIPPLNSMLLGFMRADVNGHRIVGHGGDTQFFHSALSLLPDDGVGVYVSLNSTGKEGAAGPIRTGIIEQFVDRYFPRPPEDRALDAKTAAEHARLMVGTYEQSRRMQSNFLSLFTLPGQVKVALNADSTLGVAALQGLNGQPKRWREIAPFVWREVGGKERLAAKVENGRVAMFSVDEVSPFTVFTPAPWWKSSAWLMPLLLASLTALLLTVVTWPVAAAVRRRYGVAFPLEGRAARAHRLIRIAALAALVLLGAWVATMLPLMSDLFVSSAPLGPWILTLQILSVIVFVGGAAIALWNVRTTWALPGARYAKMWSVVLVVAFLCLLWVAVVFKLISFGATY